MSDRGDIDARLYRMGEATLRPTIDTSQVIEIPSTKTISEWDDEYRTLLQTQCMSSDREKNGSLADALIAQLLRKLGLVHTADMFTQLDKL